MKIILLTILPIILLVCMINILVSAVAGTNEEHKKEMRNEIITIFGTGILKVLIFTIFISLIALLLIR